MKIKKIGKAMMILMILLLSGVLIVSAYENEMKEIRKNNVIRLSYMPDDNVEKLIDDFNTQHFINVVIDKAPLSEDHTFNLIEKRDCWRIRVFLKNIDTALSLYKEEVSSCFPSTIYLVRDMINTNNDHKITGYYCPSVDAIYLDIMNISMKTIHHEFFHAIHDHFKISRSFLSEFNSLDSCELITKYACTSESEELAEAWAYAVTNLKKSQKINLVKEKLFPLYLKNETCESRK